MSIAVSMYNSLDTLFLSVHFFGHISISNFLAAQPYLQKNPVYGAAFHSTPYTGFLYFVFLFSYLPYTFPTNTGNIRRGFSHALAVISGLHQAQSRLRSIYTSYFPPSNAIDKKFSLLSLFEIPEIFRNTYSPPI